MRFGRKAHEGPKVECGGAGSRRSKAQALGSEIRFGVVEHGQDPTNAVTGIRFEERLLAFLGMLRQVVGVGIPGVVGPACGRSESENRGDAHQPGPGAQEREIFPSHLASLG